MAKFKKEKSRKRDYKKPQEMFHPKPFHIQPMNETQQDLLDSIEEDTLTLALGPAGTGKTYCSVMKAAQMYLRGDHSQIVISRANVPTGKSIGYFPGSLEEKMTPWLMPMISVLQDALGKSYYEYMHKNNKIEIQPLETIRGRSFEDSIVLIDEAQQLTMDEIKAITTRIGKGSTMILMGDAAQTDLKHGSGLMQFANLCEKHDLPVSVVEFDVDDIVRSDIVGDLVRMFTKENL